MDQLVEFLYGNLSKDIKLSFSLARLELPNLMLFLRNLVQGWQKGTIAVEVLVKCLNYAMELLGRLDHPQELAQVIFWHELVGQEFNEWNNYRFELERIKVESLWREGAIQEALAVAIVIHSKSQKAGKQAYSGAEYDLAGANFTLGVAYKKLGAMKDALSYLQKAIRLFEGLGKLGSNMLSKTLKEQADCLKDLHLYEDSALTYKKAIALSKDLKDIRQIGIGKMQLSTVYMLQERYCDALRGFEDALILFEQLNEPASITTTLIKIGVTHRKAGDFEDAEQSLRKALSFSSNHSIREGEASSLGELGSLYSALGRLDEAISFLTQAADIYMNLGDIRFEGIVHHNIANIFIKLKRYGEARTELLLAIECKKEFGSSAEPWITWFSLHYLEFVSGNLEAASEAWHRALNEYLEYRRAGGHGHKPEESIAQAVGLAIRFDSVVEAEQAIQLLLEREDWKDNKNYLNKLQTIIDGERDLSLAKDESLDYSMSAELVILLESLAE